MALVTNWYVFALVLSSWIIGVLYGAYLTLKHYDAPARSLLTDAEVVLDD